MVKKILCAIPFLFLILGTHVAAQEQWRSSFPPLSIDLDHAITNAFAKKLNAEVTGEKVPFARRLLQLKNGQIDLLAGLLKDKAREKFAYYLSTPYKMKTNKIFLMRKGESKRLQRYEDLYNLEVGVQIGSKYFPRFDQDPKIIKYPSTNDESRIRMLLKNRFDALIHTENYATHIVHKLGLQDKVEVAPFKYTKINPVFIAISKKSALYQRKTELDEVFTKMVTSGEIDAVIQSYFENIGLEVPDYK